MAPPVGALEAGRRLGPEPAPQTPGGDKKTKEEMKTPTKYPKQTAGKCVRPQLQTPAAGGKC